MKLWAAISLPLKVNQRPLLSQPSSVSTSVVPHAFHGDGRRQLRIRDLLPQLVRSRSGKVQATTSHSQSSTRFNQSLTP